MIVLFFCYLYKYIVALIIVVSTIAKEINVIYKQFYLTSILMSA